MRKFEIGELIAAFDAKDYKTYSGAYNVNLFGIRNSEQTAGKFDDAVGIFYQDASGNWIVKQYDATTDPGLYWLQNPMRKNGTIIMVPGQYGGAYKLGVHKGYRALEQKKPMKYVRDNDKDDYLDFTLLDNPENYEESIAKTNIHRTNDHKMKSGLNNKWSAGCQVLADANDFDDLLEICEISSNRYGNSFTYTLLNIADVEQMPA